MWKYFAEYCQSHTTLLWLEIMLCISNCRFSTNWDKRWNRWSKNPRLLSFSITRNESCNIHSSTITQGHRGIVGINRMFISTWVSHLPSSHTETQLWIWIHNDLGLFIIIYIYMLLFILWRQKLQTYKYMPLHYSFHQVCLLSLFTRGFSSRWF